MTYESLARMTSTSSGNAAQASNKTNRLAGETSPYLLQHATNPVDWYPWGSEALARSKAENKPIFLSIGYSACHWCHVMERESFENPDIAALMNEHFVNIKVDREERPGPRPDLHVGRDGDDRARRLADVGVPHARAQAVLRRHVFSAVRLAGHGRFSPRSRRACIRPGRNDGKRSSSRRPR